MENLAECSRKLWQLADDRRLNLPASGELLLICSDLDKKAEMAKRLKEEGFSWSSNCPSTIILNNLSQLSEDKRILIENMILDNSLTYRFPTFYAIGAVFPIEDILTKPDIGLYRKALLSTGILEMWELEASSSDRIVGAKIPEIPSSDQAKTFLQFLHWLSTATNFHYYLVPNTFS